MAGSARYRALEQAGLLHAAPEAVSAAPFGLRPEFFACFDKVQVKYEMLRAHVLGGETVTAAAAAHGYSRASFYLVAAGFEDPDIEVHATESMPGEAGTIGSAYIRARKP